MRRLWWWVFGAAGTLVADGIYFERLINSGDEAAFQEELRLAQAEGLPSTVEEFNAQIPIVPPGEDASATYRKIDDLIAHKGWGAVASSSTRWATLARQLDFEGGEGSIKRAKTEVAGAAELLRLVEQALSRPHCRFVLVSDLELLRFEPAPPYWAVKNLLALRGALEAAEGREAAALADARRLFKLSAHARETPAERFQQDQVVYLQACYELACWASLHRNVPSYRRELEKAIRGIPPTDFRKQRLEFFYRALKFVKSKDDSIMFAQGRPVRKALIKRQFVKSLLDYSRALVGPALDLETARKNLRQVASSFSIPNSLNADLAPKEDPKFEEAYALEAKTQQFVAILRSLGGSVAPATISTNDLLSPYNGQPLEYRVEGKRAIFEVPISTKVKLRPYPLDIPIP